MLQVGVSSINQPPKRIPSSMLRTQDSKLKTNPNDGFPVYKPTANQPTPKMIQRVRIIHSQTASRTPDRTPLNPLDTTQVSQCHLQKYANWRPLQKGGSTRLNCSTQPKLWNRNLRHPQIPKDGKWNPRISEIIHLGARGAWGLGPWGLASRVWFNQSTTKKNTLPQKALTLKL